MQSQLTEIQRRIRHLENEILKSQSHEQSLQETISELESRLQSLQDTFTKEKESLQQSLAADLESRLKEEKQKWEEEHNEHTMLFTPPPLSATYPFPPMPMSPRHPPPRQFKSVSPQPDLKPSRNTFSRNTSYGDLPPLRRPSRNFSTEALSLTTGSGSAPNLPISTLEDEEEREFLSPSRGESPRNTVVDASVSTNTAGPSVNIMERMSAAVRRLESDLATTREEMSRCVKQRDEAREECVKLMGEVEEKRSIQLSLEELHRKFGDLENRYSPTRTHYSLTYSLCASSNPRLFCFYYMTSFRSFCGD